MNKKLFVRILVPLILVLLLSNLSRFLIEEDTKIQNERHEKYSGEGNIVTSYSIIFVTINFVGAIISIIIDAPLILIGKEPIINKSVMIVLSSIFYFIFIYFIICKIQNRESKKK